MVRLTKYSTLICLQKIIEKHGSNYSYASQAKLLELLETIHKVKINVRMLGYHLADLRREGLITSIKRTHRREDGTLSLLTSATCLTIAGCKYLATKGVKWAWQHLKLLVKKYVPRDTTHAAHEKDETITQSESNADSLKTKLVQARLQGVPLHSLLLKAAK